MLIIPALWEAEAVGFEVWVQIRQLGDLVRHCLKENCKELGLSLSGKALGWIPSTIKTKRHWLALSQPPRSPSYLPLVDHSLLFLDWCGVELPIIVWDIHLCSKWCFFCKVLCCFPQHRTECRAHSKHSVPADGIELWTIVSCSVFPQGLSVRTFGRNAIQTGLN